MNIKQLLITISIATVIFWIVWFSVLSQIDPFKTDLIGFVLFYLTLFFALLGIFFLISFTYRKMFTKFSLEYNIVNTSFRQSFFFSLLVISLLLLQGGRMLNTLNSLLLVATIIILEFFFLSYKRGA